MSTDTDALVSKLRYMGRQYAAGQVSRGGSPRKHYLEEAADTIERLTRERDEAVAAIREFLEFQSAAEGPTIHEWARWRRVADATRTTKATT